MCDGIALAVSEIPVGLIDQLQTRIHQRGGEQEVRFFFDDAEPCLPVLCEGQLLIVRWGNRGESHKLPRTCWTWQNTVETGFWSARGGEAVTIPATAGLEKGIWFRIRQGIRGVLVKDERGVPVAYMICDKASHYFEVMTRSRRTPVLVEETI